MQVGSRFVASAESSAHEAFKQHVVASNEGDTLLTLKELAPVRLMRNKFFKDVQAAYARGATVDDLKALLGRARAKRGMFEGDLEEGELEIGQVSAALDDVPPAAEIVQRIMDGYEKERARLAAMHPF